MGRWPWGDAIIIRDGLEDAEYLARYTSGFDTLRAHVADWTPERVAAITGLAAERVVAFAQA
jgi:anaerobic selenocysteine-containing dehydrogenase